MVRRPGRRATLVRRLWVVAAAVAVIASAWVLTAATAHAPPLSSQPADASSQPGARTFHSPNSESGLKGGPISPATAGSGASAVSVTRTIFPGFNTSLPGSFTSSIATWLVGTPTYVPSTDSLWFPQRAQAISGDPVPTIAPAAVFNLSSGEFDRLITNLSNASALAYDPGNGEIYATLPADNAVVAVSPRTGAVTGLPIPVGTAPDALALDPNSNQLFVANSGSSNVTVIDTIQDSVSIGGIATGTNPVALSDDAQDGLVFVANAGSSFLTVLNTSHPSTLSVNISLFDGPAQDLALSPRSDRLIVTTPSSQYATLVDAKAETAIDSLLPVGKGVVPITASANGTEFVLGNSSGTDLVLLNSTTGSQVAPDLLVDPNATELSLNPATGSVYCWTSRDRVLETVNLSDNSVLPVTPPVLPPLTSMSYYSDSTGLYAAATNESLIYSLDPTTLSRQAPPIEVASNPLSVMANPTADRFFAGTATGLSIFDASTGMLTSTVSGLSGGCSQLVLDLTDNLLWLSNSNVGVVAVNLTTLQVVISGTKTISASATQGIAVDPQNSETFVLVAANSVAVLDSHTGDVIAPNIAVGANLTSLVFDPADDQVYAAGDQVSMINGTTLAVDGGLAPFGNPHRVLGEVYDPSRESIFVTTVGELGSQQGIVTEINGSSVAASELSQLQIPVGEDPVAAAVVSPGDGTTPGLSEVWVANAASGTISVLSTSPTVTSFSAIPATIDLGSATTLSLAVEGGAGQIAISYGDLPPGCPTSSEMQLSCTPSASGVFEIEANVTDSLGNSASATTALTVLPSLILHTTLAPSTLPLIDIGVPLIGTASATNGLPPYSFEWSFGDGSYLSGGAVSHVYTTPGEYVVTTSVKDATGASNASSAVILVVSRPTVAIVPTPSNETDVDFPISLSTSVVGGTGAAQGTWTFGDGTTAYGPNATHAWTRSGSYTVTFEYLDKSGVSANATVNVTVRPPLGATFSSGNVSSSSPAQPASPVTFRATISGGTPPYTVDWTFGDGSMASGLTVSHSYASAGTFTVGATLKDAAGATVRTNLTVVVASTSSSGGGIASVGGGFGAGLFLGVILGGVLAAVVLFFVRPRKSEHPPAGPPAPYVPP